MRFALIGPNVALTGITNVKAGIDATTLRMFGNR